MILSLLYQKDIKIFLDFLFFPRTITGWNKLPQETVSSQSLCIFKSKLNQYNFISILTFTVILYILVQFYFLAFQSWRDVVPRFCRHNDIQIQIQIQLLPCHLQVQNWDVRNYTYIKIRGQLCLFRLVYLRCGSFVGKIGGKQDISLVPACWRKGIVIHEIGKYYRSLLQNFIYKITKIVRTL